LKSLSRNGITVPVIKLDIVIGKQKGNSVWDNDRKITVPIAVPIITCLKKYTGLRMSFPLRNNLTASHPISSIIFPNDL
jgi:hypothetical protein